ncbi:TetR family transcriptional regulator [Prauserella oleivorans]
MSTEPRKRLELLWGVSTKASRGPKPKLSLERIVTTAIDIADREGIDALSMQRLAAELGYTTMSLYRYVPSKEDLLELMIDQTPEPPRRRATHRTGERSWRPGSARCGRPTGGIRGCCACRSPHRP